MDRINERMPEWKDTKMTIKLNQQFKQHILTSQSSESISSSPISLTSIEHDGLLRDNTNKSPTIEIDTQLNELNINNNVNNLNDTTISDDDIDNK